MPETALIERAFAAGGITLAALVAVCGVVVVLWRRQLIRDREVEKERADYIASLKAEIAALQVKLDACMAARLADREAQTKQVIAELHAQRDALEAAAGAGRDQADALDAISKNVGELRAELTTLGKEVTALRATKGGGR